jgi:hypothetical protein
MSSSSSRYKFTSIDQHNMSKEERRNKELERRARSSPEVHLQMVEEHERDDELRSMFKKHLKKMHKNKWSQYSDEQKEHLINEALIKNRIPWNPPRGGKRKTRRHKSKKIVRKTNKRKSKKSKRKGRKTRRK